MYSRPNPTEPGAVERHWMITCLEGLGVLFHPKSASFYPRTCSCARGEWRPGWRGSYFDYCGNCGHTYGWRLSHFPLDAEAAIPRLEELFSTAGPLLATLEASTAWQEACELLEVFNAAPVAS